ncbi:MAG: AbrB/MazE/SpoVT family DNA-binding domain-containing protein [Thermoleophilia bacterium]
MVVGSRVTSKGQVTIPKAVRDALGIDTGDTVMFSVEEGVATLRRTAGLLELAGSVAVPEDLRGVPWSEVRRRTRAARHAG